MTDRTWNWLPDDALTGTAVLAVVDQAIAGWSARWLPVHRLQRGRVSFIEPAADHAVAARTPRLAVLATEAGAELMLDHVLNIDLRRLELGEEDRAIVGSLRDEVFRDFAQACDEALAASAEDVPDADAGSGNALIEITDDAGRRCLTLETSRAVLAGVRRSSAPVAAPRPEPLIPIREAIADSPVQLFAHVGSAMIALPEARRLAPGDVVVLDRALDGPLDLVGAAGGAPVACADLEDAASPRSLRLRAVDGKTRA